PAFATISFSSWNPVSYTGEHLFAGGPGGIDIDTSSATQLIFYLNGGDTQVSGTTTITSKPLGIGSQFETLKGNWSGLHCLSIQGGSVTITVTVGTPSTTNNMFNMTLDSSSTYDSGPLTPVSNLLNNTSYITVKFDYSSGNGIDSNPVSSTHF